MKRILVLQLNRVSDFILTTPALDALRRALPDSHITLAVDAGCRELLPACSYAADDSLVFSRKGKNGPFWRKLLFSGFDVCLDFTGSGLSAFFSVLSKAGRRATFQSVNRSWERTLFYNAFVNSSARENHTADHYLHLLRALEIKPQNASQPARLRLDLPEWTRKKSQQLLNETGVTGSFVMLHPGTLRPDKLWLPERWAEVVDFCDHQLHLPCVITGSREASELEHIAAIKPRTKFFNLAGRTDLLTLAALAQRSNLLLSVDSAAMQLGAAVGVPQVALFGKTNPFHWRPLHDKARVVVSGKPGPTVEFKPLYDSVPMSALSTQQVFGAILALTKP